MPITGQDTDWGKESEGWPSTPYTTMKWLLCSQAHVVPYGSYVAVGAKSNPWPGEGYDYSEAVIRCETLELVKKLEDAAAGMMRNSQAIQAELFTQGIVAENTADLKARAAASAKCLEGSVVQDWVHKMPLRQQGVLLLALRGPDGTRKESAAKPILRSLRACTMNSGRFGKPMDRHEVFDHDSFMRMDYICDDVLWDQVTKEFFSSTDEYNLHFYQHLLHGAAAAGLHHPMLDVRRRWWKFYEAGCHRLHMNPETPDQFAHRLRSGRRELEDE